MPVYFMSLFDSSTIVRHCSGWSFIAFFSLGIVLFWAELSEYHLNLAFSNSRNFLTLILYDSSSCQAVSFLYVSYMK